MPAFCNTDKCKGGPCRQCNIVTKLTELKLQFQPFVTETDIEPGTPVLCLVSSWEEPPYFVIMWRSSDGLIEAWSHEALEDTEILKWAYLPETVE